MVTTKFILEKYYQPAALFCMCLYILEGFIGIKKTG